MEINLEEFIDVKGLSAQGNQLTRDKVNQINLLDPLPYEAPEEVHADELEVIDEETLSDINTTKNSEIKNEDDTDSEGQITLF